MLPPRDTRRPRILLVVTVRVAEERFEVAKLEDVTVKVDIDGTIRLLLTKTEPVLRLEDATVLRIEMPGTERLVDVMLFDRIDEEVREVLEIFRAVSRRVWRLELETEVALAVEKMERLVTRRELVDMLVESKLARVLLDVNKLVVVMLVEITVPIDAALVVIRDAEDKLDVLRSVTLIEEHDALTATNEEQVIFVEAMLGQVKDDADIFVAMREAIDAFEVHNRD